MMLNGDLHHLGEMQKRRRRRRNLTLTPLPGLRMYMCICLSLMPIPGLSNVHNPDATSRVLCVYVYVLCVSVFLTPLPWLCFNVHTLGAWSGLNVCLHMWEWPMPYFQSPPSSSEGFWRRGHIKGEKC